MDNGYYIEENGEEKGPLTFEELIGTNIDLHTQVLSPKSDDWQDACDLPELYPYFEARGIVFPTEDNLASFWWRLLAYIIDYFILSFLSGLAFSFLATYGIKFSLQSYNDLFKLSLSQVLAIEFIVSAILVIYNSVCEASPMKGSLGKKLCGLIVVDIDGAGLSYLNALGRSAAKVISISIFYLGFLSIFFSERRQALHDYLAKTYVVKL
ncbi:RDD family protein [Mucilaginibacter sp. X4EP1]|uniref:RDD family protein n=1 Tax=Mucilaginibacter sp. X4EP1 TaxID=2723092 RepID=UPI002169527D|nr:RDD family protein [Mucilaginibacter sp. X4EP1]MCS3813994.1 putative RDD family membrane protein YckC [Mucilaginibacter sp. X4EP1]